MQTSSRSDARVQCSECDERAAEIVGVARSDHASLRRLGWLWHADGRVLCPACNERTPTTPVPAAAAP